MADVEDTVGQAVVRGASRHPPAVLQSQPPPGDDFDADVNVGANVTVESIT